MRTRAEPNRPVAPVRLLEMLEARFGAFEALAYTSLALARKTDAEEESPPMDILTAEAVLEFGDDLRQAYQAAVEWTDQRRAVFVPEPSDEYLPTVAKEC